jgi:hypothetical protein
MINQQINTFLQNTAQLCLKRSLKLGFLKLIKILLKISAVYAIFQGRKNKYLRTCESFQSANKLVSVIRKSTNYKSANHEKYGVRKSQIRKLTHYRKICKFADLRFAELICGPPTFDITTL